MVAFACGACGYSWQRPEGSEEARQALAQAETKPAKPGAAKASRPKVPLRRKG